jgi:hypothetical protein
MKRTPGAREHGLLSPAEIGDLLERFRRGGELVATATTGCAGTELDFRPTPDKWTIRQVVSHLADSELVIGMRFRQTIAEDNPTLIWYDEKAWADKLDWNRRKLSVSIEAIRRNRNETYEILKSQPEEAWSRPANHSQFGATTLGEMLRAYAEHVENHVNQIRGLRQQYKESRK